MLNKIYMPALFGLESSVSKELQDLGYQKSQIQVFDAEVCLTLNHAAEMPRAIAKLNYNLRTAERVLLGLAEFSALDFEQLFEKISALPWHEWLDRYYFIEITGYSRNSKLHSIPACQRIIKKAIIKELNSVYQYQNGIVPESKKAGIYRIQFSIVKDWICLKLDTSGEPLHKRGYRPETHEAPIRETLAAAILLLSFYKRNIANGEILYDPFCGSGTFLIEAALIASKTAPGINRHFSGEKKKLIGQKAFWQERQKALEKSVNYGEFTETASQLALAERIKEKTTSEEIRRKTFYQDNFTNRKDFLLPYEKTRIFGSDISAEAIRLAKENACRADVSEYIHLEQKNIHHLQHNDLVNKLGGNRILMATNPPYGERMGNLDETRHLEKQIKFLCFHEQEKLRKGMRLSLITSDNEVEAVIGKKADKRRKLYNGGIRCTLFHYFKQD